MKPPLHQGREVQNGGGGEARAPLLSIVPRDPPPPQSPGKGSNTHTQCKSCAWKIPGSGVPPAPRPLLPQPPAPPRPAAVSIATDVARRQLSGLINDRAA